jgi:hypothetical protein
MGCKSTPAPGHCSEHPGELGLRRSKKNVSLYRLGAVRVQSRHETERVSAAALFFVSFLLGAKEVNEIIVKTVLEDRINRIIPDKSN